MKGVCFHPLKRRINLKPLQNKLHNDDDYKYLFDLFVLHQQQLQEAFNIITMISMGSIAAFGVLFTAGIKYYSFVVILGFVSSFTFTVETIGIVKQKREIYKERETLLLMLSKKKDDSYLTIARDFYSMPDYIINASIVIFVLEAIAFTGAMIYAGISLILL